MNISLPRRFVTFCTILALVKTAAIPMKKSGLETKAISLPHTQSFVMPSNEVSLSKLSRFYTPEMYDPPQNPSVTQEISGEETCACEQNTSMMEVKFCATPIRKWF